MAQSHTYTVAANGGWLLNSTWGVSGGATNSPGSNAGDNAIINNFTVFYNTNTTIANLTVNGTGTLNFNQAGTNTLNVSNTTTLNATGATINISTSGESLITANLNVSAGNYIQNAGTTIVNNNASVNGGTVNIPGGTYNGNGNLTVNGQVRGATVAAEPLWDPKNERLRA